MSDEKAYEEKLPTPGTWPECEVGQWYRVLHEWDKGKVGNCISTSETLFGHRHARLRFKDGHERGFRTHDLQLV